ncbi:hypothetical protein SLA2020_412100 [Shorea laevis]
MRFGDTWRYVMKKRQPVGRRSTDLGMVIAVSMVLFSKGDLVVMRVKVAITWWFWKDSFGICWFPGSLNCICTLLLDFHNQLHERSGKH